MFGTIYQAGLLCVAFDVPHKRVEVLVGLHWKRLETILIEVAAARGFEVRVPAHHMGVREPADELRELAVFSRPDHHVPVVRHDNVGQQPRGMLDHRLGEDSLEGFVGVLFEVSGMVMVDPSTSSARRRFHLQSVGAWASVSRPVSRINRRETSSGRRSRAVQYALVSAEQALRTQTLNQFLPQLHAAVSLEAWWNSLLAAIATHTVGNRPNRYEPRLRKRRPKPYKHLREARANYKRTHAR